MKFTKNIQVQFKYFKPVHRNSFLFLLTILFSTLLNAQTIPSKPISSDVRIVNDSVNHKVNIEFRTDKEIYNVLVLISDSLGNTMFLDNQYRFKGYYKHTVDLKEAKKGNYSLKIIRDDEEIVKKLKVE